MASRDPSLYGSKIVWPGEPGADAAGMSPALRDMVEEIRRDKQGVPHRAKGYISTEEVCKDQLISYLFT